MILIAGTILGERYEIIEKIGAGGMSIVYKAKCNRLQRFVAVKVLREEFAKDEVFVKKFRAEALSAASLSHPNIVGIYDVGSEQDLHYIVMEYVEGQTLKELIDKDGPLSEKLVLDYGTQILLAIRHAHTKKIIHRDIKPQNILVTPDKVLKVADFGIARAVDSSTIVAAGNAIGSVHYFSPEQAKGKYVNETSDLYSCGIVLFELATKRLPFDADSHVSIALKHINEEIPNPSLFNPNISNGLEQIILKATNKKQELRYQSADEMIKDIKGVENNPNYVVVQNIVSEVTDNTVLLTSLETDMIRQQSEKQEVSEPIKASPKALAVDEVYDEDFEDEEDEKISPFYKFLVGLGGVLATLVALGIIAFCFFFFMPSFTKTDAVVVPKIEGKLLKEAQAIAEERGLTINVISTEEKEGIEPDTILKQNPKAEATIAKNGVIEVTVATEVKITMVEVPDIVGIDGAEAQRTLEAKDLYAKVERAYDDTIEVGKVISQSPLANTEVQEGDIITIVISKGPEMVVVNVPNLLGITQADASISLKNAKLTLGKVTEEFSATVEKGLVMKQSISTNNRVEQGTAIDIIISKGPEEIKEPEEPEVPTPEEPDQGLGEDEEQEQATESQEVTKTYILNVPSEDKDQYHVVITFETDEGYKTLFDGIVKRQQLPMPIELKGSGSGKLVTYFDGVEEFRDPYSF